ncbi:unnamed protein product [Closterium sp. NIES-64]|nr:unnamed protein product [Closterium sp. NIES-64]
MTLHQYRQEMRRDLCAHATGDLIQQLEVLGIKIPPKDAGRVTEGGAVVRERNGGIEDGDTSGHETVKAKEEEDLVSDTEDEEDGDDTCATKYTGVKLEKASGKFGVKILIKEGGKRRQQRLGAYISEEEAAYAYAAAPGGSAEVVEVAELAGGEGGRELEDETREEASGCHAHVKEAEGGG